MHSRAAGLSQGVAFLFCSIMRFSGFFILESADYAIKIFQGQNGVSSKESFAYLFLLVNTTHFLGVTAFSLVNLSFSYTCSIFEFFLEVKRKLFCVNDLKHIAKSCDIALRVCMMQMPRQKMPMSKRSYDSFFCTLQHYMANRCTACSRNCCMPIVQLLSGWSF